MNEDTQEALNPVAEEQTAQTESPAEDQTVEVSDPVSTEAPAVPKKGAQARIRELSAETRSLKDRIAELTNPVGLSAPRVPYQPQENRPLVGADESIDGAELERRMQEREQRILQQANQMVDFKTQQHLAIQRINQETVEVVGKFKELDPESEFFDKELSDAIYESVEAKVKTDPTASVKDFVTKQMKLYKREVAREEARDSAVIAKQAAQSAIRPSQTKPVDTKFEDLSIEEMRSKLGYAQ
jgi:hypothetical protein